MNTNKLKAYAPKARLAFMDAVKKRAAVLGIYENKISEATTQGTDTLIEGRIFTRKQGQQRQQLVNRIEALGGGKDGYNQFINEMAFTWFNRFTAIRFMEVNGYLDHGFRILSKEEGAEFGQGFEILAHAADVAEDLGLNKADIVEMLLAGDKEEELYRELLLAQCHQLSKIMPFMFEKLDDATELLLPDNLTKTDSILKALVNDVPEDNWREIEVIGWLYQFYISEHKDAVIGKVVKKEDIPAATQLFTPNWIVKYLVQNSLGRQWLATYPDSELKDKMEYYISPAEQSDEVIEQLKAITPTSIDPEQIKVLDPACGSGHILVEVYEVLREIYLERGYRLREIPELILTKNIYGLDIDDRAAQMAAFAVLMKAREDDRRIFSRVEDNHIKLNIHAIQSTEHININKLWSDLDLDENKQAGSIDDLFAEPQLDIGEASEENKVYLDLLRHLKEQFIDAKNLGSLVEVDSQNLEPLTALQEKLAGKAQGNEPTTREAAQALLPIVEQAIVLATKYDVAVANPPYMGSKGMNTSLKNYAKKEYPDSKSDLFAIFMERVFNFLNENGYNAQVNMQSWMFLPSFKELRESQLNNNTLHCLAHLGSRAFSQISGEVVQTCAWVISKARCCAFRPSFQRLVNGNEQVKKHALLERQFLFEELTQEQFLNIPSSPLCYWLNREELKSFSYEKCKSFANSEGKNITSDNDRFLRYFWEVSSKTVGRGSTWLPYAKGGEFRKWYGNLEHVVNWSEQARNYYKKHPSGRIISEEQWYLEGITWTPVATNGSGFRLLPENTTFDSKGLAIFPFNSANTYPLLAILNSKYAAYILNAINPTLMINLIDVQAIPIAENALKNSELVKEVVNLHKKDWDERVTSLDFAKSPIHEMPTQCLKIAVNDYLLNWKKNIFKALKIEQELNNHICESYGLKEPEWAKVLIRDITLSKNISTNIESDDEFLVDLRSSTFVEYIEYYLGCIMGRYSLDREGLVYAYSGNIGFKELVTEGAYKTFPADDDGIIPLAAEEWLFDDDATSRFRDFVKTVWGEEHLQENLDFVAESLCLDAIKPKKNESSMETIRRYFSTQFYKDHLKTYKKRPIYWLFSSGKEKAFECLVYLHRYNESTLARMRTEYVTPLMGKLETQHSVLTESRTNASSTEQRRIDKELKSIEKKQSELRAFDEELKHLAEMKISIDLDDGVKVNYGKFGNLLADVKAIHGKNPEEIK
ncbi:BREX-1 system adenine-specific DNA-methyltransferase PglX [Vibrio parahaemolyticus]|uniref:BREX-1 system adenine-specific DNA-methyltransferase PglX n=1 Tax=Vibrio parahaemolyticus TaxID=670 RepID=UPI0011239C53|nr:BREX-1 system adenine-specific DNA-methyltransferase PglX [Vibrio parahaemolyticus]EHR7857037.1 BREX-1 system adenine-specific DNA-methyltransferase PglX [Vibrio parahaemolyticus]MBE3836063.1 BREX-1 system adenine-specific DNA-methyltransferase PglX [Vibrio parahaemolyticus]TOA76602.1 SAM-dependent methyltransferase [Vibrio parahaemolyticus]TOF28447.1 SAM-dependent methyltransferase [Vibrio parahaemolyticus]HCE1511592.1 BREX-1 system adenine-specific DNA-methyltransferase PglX [Vibrio parah